MKLRLISLCSLLSLLAFQVNAMPSYAYPAIPSGMQQQEVGPGAILKQGVTSLLKFMRQKQRPDPKTLNHFLQTQIAPYFDFDYMARWAAGPAYRSMNEQQRKAMAKKVKEMLLGTLAQRLGSYQNQDVRFFRPRRVGENEVKARVGILRAGGYPASIDFRFYRGDSGWKVFDVTANGTSALTYYRRHFAQQLRRQRNAWAYRR